MKINLKQAGMVAMASTLVMSSILATPKLVEAKYMNAIEATQYSQTEKANQNYSYIQDDIWFKAIFPNWNGDAKGKELVDFYENTFKGPTVPSDKAGTHRQKWTFINEHTTDPDHGYYDEDKQSDIHLNNYYAKLDPSKQYFPTLEFKVGSDIAYVDGKPFKLEAKVIRNKQGKVLVPMYHLASILSTNKFKSTTVMNAGEGTTTLGVVSLMSPIGVNRDMAVSVRNSNISIPNGKDKAIYSAWDSYKAKPAPANHPAQGACVLNNTIYAPVAWLATATNAGKAEWNQAKQVAKINGQYHKEAVPYGIFKQAGTSSEYNIFKDWEMQPKQPVASKY